MTREELDKLKALVVSMEYMTNVFINGEQAVLDKAIKELEQEDILDKIRAEIEGLTYYWCEIHPKNVIDDVLEIIDKYTAESEG